MGERTTLYTVKKERGNQDILLVCQKEKGENEDGEDEEQLRRGMRRRRN